MPAGGVADSVAAYQRWQLGLSERAASAAAPPIERAIAGTNAVGTLSNAPIPRQAALDAWRLLGGPSQDALAARERFALTLRDGSLAPDEHHEARLGFVLAATLGGEISAAAMSARRVDSSAVLVVPAELASAIDLAKERATAQSPDDGGALLRILGLLRVTEARADLAPGIDPPDSPA